MAEIDMGRKLGAVPLLRGERELQRRLGRGLPVYQVAS